MLQPVKDTFQAIHYPDLLVGLDSVDDAAVWRLDNQRAVVLTTDFFTPVVDDPYDYGSIAAANSLSDIYAMGGMPFLALNIAAMPPNLPAEIVSQIIRGGAEKARQAGVIIAGGHTVQDKEPKYGLAVLGFVHPDHVLTKGGAQPGDFLALTKPLGFGVTTTALKREKASEEDIAEVIRWMTALNDKASQIAVACELKAATDITGYSFLGHVWEMAHASQVGLHIKFDNIPFVSCAQKYAQAWTFPGGASDNRMYFGKHVSFSPNIDEASQMLLFDPQTSGGLLLSIPAQKLAIFEEQAAALQQPVWIVGQVIEGNSILVE